MLAVHGRRSLGLPVELDERHARAAGALEPTACAVALPQQQPVNDPAEPHQASDTFNRQLARIDIWVGLEPVAGRRIGGFSLGMRRRLCGVTTENGPQAVVLCRPVGVQKGLQEHVAGCPWAGAGRGGDDLWFVEDRLAVGAPGISDPAVVCRARRRR